MYLRTVSYEVILVTRRFTWLTRVTLTYEILSDCYPRSDIIKVIAFLNKSF